MENHLYGLPEHGVLLTGSPHNPVIENHSGRTVIAYVLFAAGQDGDDQSTGYYWRLPSSRQGFLMAVRSTP